MKRKIDLLEVDRISSRVSANHVISLPPSRKSWDGCTAATPVESFRSSLGINMCKNQVSAPFDCPLSCIGEIMELGVPIKTEIDDEGFDSNRGEGK